MDDRVRWTGYRPWGAGRVTLFRRWTVRAAISLSCALLLLVAASGCVKRWTKPGADWKQFKEDRAHCERVASLRSGILQDEGRFDRCMEARGYRRK